tara:strand:- start:105 stop:956 length:852 start_codon:yes stop_codon:yes gene_type:complete
MHIDLSKSLEEPSLEYTAGKILYAVDVNRPAHFWDAQDIREALPIWKEVIFYGTNTKYIKDAVSLLFSVSTYSKKLKSEMQTLKDSVLKLIRDELGKECDRFSVKNVPRKAYSEIKRNNIQRKEARELESLRSSYGLPANIDLADARKEKGKIDKTKKQESLGIGADADISLAVEIKKALDESLKDIYGYLYFKVWSLPDGSKWYKIGVTNSPSRRDIEQNVLPVKAQSLITQKLSSMEHARAAEAAIHQVLDKFRIRNANNRELFSLKPSQVASIKQIIENM